MHDSGWVARKLCEFEQMVCAAPAYLRRSGSLASAHDLMRHDWLLFATPDKARSFDFSGPGGEALSLRVEGRNNSNKQEAQQQMCLAGLGSAVMETAHVG